MKVKFLIILRVLVKSTFAQFQGPIPAIASGYGSDGVLPVSVINIPNDHFLIKDISVFYPTGTTTPIPTIFYLHGYGGNDTTNQIELLHHIASKGYTVVFVPYKALKVTVEEMYLTLFDGFVKSADSLPLLIDTSRIGFYGHSFGGGATPRIAYRFFTERNWGINAKFIYCSAPWYSFELGTTNLDNFPTDCKMLTVLYDNDDTNDHRMGMDIFNNIAINDSIKDCIIVKSDTINGYVYEANHNLPGQYLNNCEFDALDYYVTFRLFDALADYTFTGNSTAKGIALGNGSATQIDMGGQLIQLTETDSPSPIYPDSLYLFPCNSVNNERQAFCQDIVTIGKESLIQDEINIYPNPATNQLTVETAQLTKEYTLTIFNINGQELIRQQIKERNTKIDISNLISGIYLVKFNTNKVIEVRKIIIE